MSNYILIDRNNIPQPGDIIATEKDLLTHDDIDFEIEFEPGFLHEILDVGPIDTKSGCPSFVTRDLQLTHLEPIYKHRIIESHFNDYYIIVDKSEVNRRKFKIDILLND